MTAAVARVLPEQRCYDAAETARLGAAIRAAGDDPARFGLAG